MELYALIIWKLCKQVKNLVYIISIFIKVRSVEWGGGLKKANRVGSKVLINTMDLRLNKKLITINYDAKVNNFYASFN